MSKNSMGKHLKIVLKEMCKRVKAPFYKVNSKTNWYQLYSWTQEQEDDFKTWLVDYFYNNKEAREELLAYPRLKTKKHLKDVVNFFVFNYGWSLKKEKYH